MKLTLADGQTYAIHFRHERIEDNTLWNWQTIATVHAGPCKEKARPCGTESLVGVAYSSKKDNFNKAVGRKIALHRALMSGSARPVRAAIWAEYLRVFPPARTQ